jgi:hypothetical protein
MRLRTETQLYDYVDADLIWRKKELTQIRFLLEQSRGRKDREDVVLRGAVTLLYAHWEGFVRSSGLAYLDFVAMQRLRLEELAPNFLALSLRGRLASLTSSAGFRLHLDVTNFFLSGLKDRASIPYRDGISTRSNLSSAVLRRILDVLGFDFSPYESKEKLVDETLLHSRNTIAHGEYLLLTEDTYRVLSTDILGLMEIFRTQIQNAVTRRAYQAQPTQ